MKKLIALIACVLCCSFALAGCGTTKEVETEPAQENDAAVVGSWSESYFDSGYTFSADGTGMDTFWSLPFTYTAYDGVLTITYDDDSYGVDVYSYVVTGSQITMTRQSESDKSFVYDKK